MALLPCPAGKPSKVTEEVGEDARITLTPELLGLRPRNCNFSELFIAGPSESRNEGLREGQDQQLTLAAVCDYTPISGVIHVLAVGPPRQELLERA